jgi:hypothetical protein
MGTWRPGFVPPSPQFKILSKGQRGRKRQVLIQEKVASGSEECPDTRLYGVQGNLYIYCTVREVASNEMKGRSGLVRIL